MTSAHDARAISLLRDDVSTWRDIAERWIRSAVDSQLRLLAAQRMLTSQAERIADQQRTIERQQEQIEAQRDCWARMSRETLESGR